MPKITTHDLIITVDPCNDSKHITCVSSGVVAKCVSSTSLKPVPSCVSSGKFRLDLGGGGAPVPRTAVAMRYQKQLRQALRSTVATRKLEVPFPTHINMLLEEMSPKTLREVRSLERTFRNALKELERMKRALTTRGRARRTR